VNLPSLQALAAEYSEANYLDGDPCAPWKSTPFAADDSCSAKMKDTFHHSPFGTMYVPSADSSGAELLTWFLAAFPAKTSAQPAVAQDSTERAADYGWNLPGSFAKFDPATSSWKTRQCSLAGDSIEFLETWPAWGSMQSGECLERPTLAPTTSEREYGYWPTPQASDSMRARMRVESFQKVHADSRGGRSYLARVLAHEFGLSQSAEFTEWLMIWPEGWTDLKPLAMDKFQEWLQQHGKS
jgi:hypothetical protein